VFNIGGQDSQQNAVVPELSHLRGVDEMKSPWPEPHVDDDPVEDVCLLVGEDMLYDADRFAVGTEHIRARLEGEVRDWIARFHPRSITLGRGRGLGVDSQQLKAFLERHGLDHDVAELRRAGGVSRADSRGVVRVYAKVS